MAIKEFAVFVTIHNLPKHMENLTLLFWCFCLVKNNNSRGCICFWQQCHWYLYPAFALILICNEKARLVKKNIFQIFSKYFVSIKIRTYIWKACWRSFGKERRSTTLRLSYPNSKGSRGGILSQNSWLIFGHY